MREMMRGMVGLLLLLLVVAADVRAQDAPRPGQTEQAALVGSWGGVLELPTHPEQMAVLPSGKVIMWPWAPGRRDPPHGPVALWDPSDGSSRVYLDAGIESASGLAFQPDGVLLSAGGDQPNGGIDGNARSFLVDYRSESIRQIPPMSRGRVFPSATTLGDGRILVAAGLDDEREVNAIPELWDGSRWSGLRDARNAESVGPTYQFLAPDGRLFRAGPEPLTDWLDVESQTWSDVEQNRPNRTRYQGSAVMYEVGKILLMGGCPTYRCEDSSPVATAEVIDLRSLAPVWIESEPMSVPRHSHHATLLPDGKVLVTGGTDQPEVFNNGQAGLLSAELWDPAAESFTPVAPMGAPRHFQSTAVLLPDGRVLVAGGAFGTSPDDATFASTGQIYSPPYLHRGPRPTLTRAPSLVRYEQLFEVGTPDAAAIAHVTAVALSASSQGWNGTQRMVRLGFHKRDGALEVEAPRQSTEAPPGFYLLFLLNDRGVPSSGHSMRVAR